MPVTLSLVVFVSLLLATGAMRLVETAVSVRRMRQRPGAVVAEPRLFPLMAVLHVGLVFGPIAEVVLAHRPFLPALATVAAAVLVLATALRVWTLRTIGQAWNVRVVVPDGEAIVTGGPYRFIRHPNYLVVILEIAALPLLHTAWVSALVLSALNAFVLFHRIRTEEAALSQVPAWRAAMADRARLVPWLLLAMAAVLPGCTREAHMGDWLVRFDNDSGTLHITHAALPFSLEQVSLVTGQGSADVTMAFGSFLFRDVEQSLSASGGFGRLRNRATPVVADVEDVTGGSLGTLLFIPLGPDALVMEWSAADPSDDRLGFTAACDGTDHFLGMGGHAMDVDHVGQAFGLWVSEPGIGKVDTEEPPADWVITGTRHAASFPVPFLLRPHRQQGIVVDATSRIELDLCHTDPQRFSAVAWQTGVLRVVFLAGNDAMGPVRALSSYTGPYDLPPPWVFAPWNDAIRGTDRVNEVAQALRQAGAPSSVIWTEDWRGATQTGLGYHLDGEWSLDEGLYPDAAEVATALEDLGFKWLAYFSPFVRSETRAWDEAVDAGVLIRDADGDVYTFQGTTLEDESLLDLSVPPARDWAQERMRAVLDLGFDGWMADYAEWLPTDARLGNGADALEVHNAYPLWWQQTNADLLAGEDAVFFVRSGWLGTRGMVPVVWGGDQRTSFEPDDGLPSVVAMGAGLGASGVPVFTHDVAGYQSIGNPPSDAELWFRWASLGAFTPILRTHHGAFDTDNHQFDTDAATLAHWVAVTGEHMRLFPYRYGLAARAARDGTPMVLPPALALGDGDWGRTDAWMLGEALLVAPVLERGVTGRHVDLPAGVAWFDWWTHEPVQSGFFAADIDEIPVFAASGTTVPMFAEPPDTLVPTSAPGVTDLDDVETSRVVLLFGGGGDFEEADGTVYAPSGSPTGSGQSTVTLTSGTIDVAGVALSVDGPIERTYTVIVVAGP